MAHADQFEFIRLVKQHFPTFFEGTSVLEIGSLDINGSVRKFFSGTKYTGVDVGPGPGVDEVGQGQLVGHPSGTFDVVISCECMEHNPFWVETVSNMFRMAKPGGLVIVSCATTGRAEHGTTRSSTGDSPLSIGIGWEYYKNVSIAEFKQAFNLDYWCDDYVLLPNWHNCDLYFAGLVKPSAKAAEIGLLRQDLEKRFNAMQSVRSFCVSIAATLFGESGVGILRTIWRRVSPAR
jgi:SAM-dependent methyltransferase